MPPKDTLGPFRVLRPVPPEAGLGPEVSVARWDGDGEHAGELVLLRRYEAKGLGRARVLRELGQAKNLRHRALAKVHGWYDDDGALVAVFEHVEGARLDQIIGHLAERGARLSDDAIGELSLQVAEAIAHVQEAKDDRGRGLKLVHGTLAPDRLVVGWDGHVKVYGAALRSLFAAGGRAKVMRAYTSPELRGGSHGTSRGDVFALGMIMWTLFTGRIPEPDGSPPEKIGRFREGLDDALRRTIDTAVDRVALKRRVTCRGVAQLLQTLVSTDTLGEEMKAFVDVGFGLEDPYVEPEMAEDDEEDVATLKPMGSDPPEDEGGRLRHPTPPEVNEDSTIERLSDLLDTLEVGSEQPAPDSTDEGWLVDVVRKSSPEFLADQVAQKQPEPDAPRDDPPKAPAPPPLPAPDSTPEPKREPERAPDPKPKPEPDPKPRPKPEPKPEPARDRGPDPGPEPARDPDPDPDPIPAYPADMIVPGAHLPAPAPKPPKRRPWLMAAVGAGIGLGAAYFVTAGPTDPAPSTATSSSAPIVPPTPTVTPTPAPEPTTEPAPAPTVVTEPPPQPTTTPTGEPTGLPPVKDDGGDPSELLSNQAYLIVRSPIVAEVVVQGVSRGMTNEKVVSSCYTRNVRLRDPDTKGWLSDGQAVIIPCMETTTVTIAP